MNQSPSQHLANKQKQESFLYTIVNGQEFYTIEGERYSREEVNQMLPLATRIEIPSAKFPTTDIDGRRSWMHQ